MTAGRQITKRVTINYPLHQKHVLRVKPTIVLSDLFRLAVEQKSLDPGGYELRHPTQSDLVLDLYAPLSQYGVAEITLAAKTHNGKSVALYLILVSGGDLS